MSDTPAAPDPSPVGIATDVEVDPKSFLPEGTSFEVDDGAGDRAQTSIAEPKLGAGDSR